MEFFRFLLSRRDAGWVADFCPICSEVRAHRVQREEATCLTCQAVRPIEMSDFHAIANHCPESLDVLVRETQPELEGDYGGARPSTLRARLAVLSHQVSHHHDHAELSPRGKWAAALGIGLFALTVLTVIGGSALRFVHVNSAWLAWIGVNGLAMIVSVIFCMSDAYPWFLKTRFRPQLRRALRPLAPTIADLEVVLAQLPEDDVLTGKHFGAAKLHEWIESDGR